MGVSMLLGKEVIKIDLFRRPPYLFLVNLCPVWVQFSTEKVRREIKMQNSNPHILRFAVLFVLGLLFVGVGIGIGVYMLSKQSFTWRNIAELFICVIIGIIFFVISFSSFITAARSSNRSDEGDRRN
jgi:cytochrome c biogenesis protein CcdA